MSNVLADPAQLLYEAACAGDDNEVKALLEAKADPNTLAPIGKGFPIHGAVRYGKGDTAQLLVQAGARLNDVADETWGYAPIHLAARHNCLQAAQVLLEAKASVDCRAKPAEVTALGYAALKGHLELANLLLQHGAQVNVRDKVGRSPLHQAASGGHDAMVSLLLNQGADVGAQDGKECEHDDDNDNNSNSSSSPSDREEMLRAINARKGVVVKRQKQSQRQPLLYAVTFGHASTALLLIEGGADVNAVSATGQTCLHQTARLGLPRMVKLLLDHKAAPNLKSADGRTALASIPAVEKEEQKAKAQALSLFEVATTEDTESKAREQEASAAKQKAFDECRALLEPVTEAPV